MRGRPKKNIIPYHRHQEVVVDYRDRGTSLQTIARQYDVTQYEVTNVLKANGVQMRRRGRAAEKAATYAGDLISPLGE